MPLLQDVKVWKGEWPLKARDLEVLDEIGCVPRGVVKIKLLALIASQNPPTTFLTRSYVPLKVD